MNADWDTHKPLESFFPRLATQDAVTVALRKEFAKRTPAIITKLKTGQPLLDDELSAHDIITDLVHNKSEAVKTLYRRNQEEVDDDEKEYVNIMRFGTGKGHYVYWIQADSSETGYFGGMKAAKKYADLIYVP
jgi:hypothetical protein